MSMTPSLDSLFVVPVTDIQIDESASLEQLIRDKNVLENNLSLLFDHLTLNHSDMQTPLITPDGFPRSDIDVLQVRFTRSKINIYRNDLKQVMKLIDAKLVEKLSINNGIEKMSILETSTQRSKDNVISSIPFAIVAEVIEQSPAAISGLLVGDKIIQIGSINATNHDNLTKIPVLVSNNENKLIKLVILRNGETVELSLTPTKNWPGQGLLGCKLKLC